MITSTKNIQLKQIVKLNSSSRARMREGLFCTEGWKLFKETPANLIKKVYVSESFFNALQPEDRLYVEMFSTAIVSDPVFPSISDVSTPQGILTLTGFPQTVRSKNAKNPLYLVLEDIQDPGNLGTIFRTAEGAGIDRIYMSAGCADIFSPKTVRATMGSIFRVPFEISGDIPSLISSFNSDGISTYAAALYKTSRIYDECDFTSKTAIIIGNESNGLKEESILAASDKIIIPMSGKLESLNASIAAAIIMYEAKRQRKC